MERIKRRISINDDVEFDGQSYAGFTGTTSCVSDTGVWWIDLDSSCTSNFSYEYKKLCLREDAALDVICLEEKDFVFID